MIYYCSIITIPLFLFNHYFYLFIFCKIVQVSHPRWFLFIYLFFHKKLSLYFQDFKNLSNRILWGSTFTLCISSSLLRLYSPCFKVLFVRFIELTEIPLPLRHLKQQQEGLCHLISIIKDDLEDISLTEHSLSDSSHMSDGVLSWVCLSRHQCLSVSCHPHRSCLTGCWILTSRLV